MFWEKNTFVKYYEKLMELLLNKKKYNIITSFATLIVMHDFVFKKVVFHLWLTL